jgi:hypothetical protein
VEEKTSDDTAEDVKTKKTSSFKGTASSTYTSRAFIVKTTMMIMMIMVMTILSNLLLVLGNISI